MWPKWLHRDCHRPPTTSARDHVTRGPLGAVSRILLSAAAISASLDSQPTTIPIGTGYDWATTTANPPSTRLSRRSKPAEFMAGARAAYSV